MILVTYSILLCSLFDPMNKDSPNHGNIKPSSGTRINDSEVNDHVTSPGCYFIIILYDSYPSWFITAHFGSCDVSAQIILFRCAHFRATDFRFCLVVGYVTNVQHWDLSNKISIESIQQKIHRGKLKKRISSLNSAIVLSNQYITKPLCVPNFEELWFYFSSILNNSRSSSRKSSMKYDDRGTTCFNSERPILQV